MGTVEHPRIRPEVLEDRLYQRTIAETAVERNTLVVLPTGLGKTAIALRVMAEFLLRRPTASILFMAPTRPLVVQHARSVASTLFAPEPLTLTGAVSPERRAALLRPPQVVLATPQVVANDLRIAEFPLDTFSLIVFDEAHRAVGEYPYVAIGEANRQGPRARVLAMTASPGGAAAASSRSGRTSASSGSSTGPSPARTSHRTCTGSGSRRSRSPFRSRSSTSRSCSAPRSPGRSTCSDGSGSCRPATRVSVPSSRSENGSIGRST